MAVSPGKEGSTKGIRDGSLEVLTYIRRDFDDRKCHHYRALGTLGSEIRKRESTFVCGELNLKSRSLSHFCWRRSNYHSGIAMLHKMKLDFLDTPWLVHGTAALALSTLVWLGFLLPDQFRMKEHAKSSNLEAFKKAYIRWSILGWLATAPLVYGVWVMVVK